MDLYYLLGSPPCHAVLVTAKAIGVKFNPKIVDYVGGEHLKPAYLKMNPQHTVPTIMDNGFPLWESRAIMIYLTEKYAKDDSLYPKCIEKRALINQRLYFDMTLYQQLADYFYPPVIKKSAPNPDKLEKIKGSMVSLNTFLEGKQYAAGESLTLADIALGVTVSCLDSLAFDISKYPNVQKWYQHIQEVTPGYDQNLQGLVAFKKYFNPN